jgi:hypothetical protein
MYKDKDLKVKPSVGNLNLDNDDSKSITLIVDASGLTMTKKGDYIKQKQKEKRVYQATYCSRC